MFNFLKRKKKRKEGYDISDVLASMSDWNLRMLKLRHATMELHIAWDRIKKEQEKKSQEFKELILSK